MAKRPVRPGEIFHRQSYELFNGMKVSAEYRAVAPSTSGFRSEDESGKYPGIEMLVALPMGDVHSKALPDVLCSKETFFDGVLGVSWGEQYHCSVGTPDYKIDFSHHRVKFVVERGPNLSIAFMDLQRRFHDEVVKLDDRVREKVSENSLRDQILASTYDSLMIEEPDPEGGLEESRFIQTWKDGTNEFYTVIAYESNRWICDLSFVRQDKEIRRCLVHRVAFEARHLFVEDELQRLDVAPSLKIMLFRYSPYRGIEREKSLPDLSGYTWHV